jgi:steroid 5-alpha reductase family enzyme
MSFLAGVWISFETVLVVMLTFYVLGSWKRNHGLVDIAWGLGIGCLAARLAWAMRGSPLQLLQTVLVVLWSLRLSVYLFLRNWGKPEDFRYAAWREKWRGSWWWRSFFQVYALQGALQLLVVFPLMLVFRDGVQEVGMVEVMGAGLSLLGLLIETIADAQKFFFKRDPGNRERIMQSGLWRYSRHPNYFGEAVFWWGIGLMALRVEWGWIGLLSPLLMNWLLLKVSGVPMLEERWVLRPEFEEYRRRTNRFVLGRPKFDSTNINRNDISF